MTSFQITDFYLILANLELDTVIRGLLMQKLKMKSALVACINYDRHNVRIPCPFSSRLIPITIAYAIPPRAHAGHQGSSDLTSIQKVSDRLAEDCLPINGNRGDQSKTTTRIPSFVKSNFKIN